MKKCSSRRTSHRSLGRYVVVTGIGRHLAVARLVTDPLQGTSSSLESADACELLHRCPARNVVVTEMGVGVEIR